jgi:preprotein translocase subunit SecD
MFKSLLVLAAMWGILGGAGSSTLGFSLRDSETNEWVATELNESYLVSVKVEMTDYDQPVVFLNFNDEGAKLFEEITGDNIGRELAIFLDREMISAPIIRDRITRGDAQIAGNFTSAEAEALAKKLRATINGNKAMKTVRGF